MKTREEWENTGLLGGLENVDADRVVRLFNFCEDILEFHIHGLMDDEIMLMYPVIRRIYGGLKKSVTDTVYLQMELTGILILLKL